MEAGALAELARRYWFDAVASCLGGGGSGHAGRLAEVGQRTLALDAEDFFSLAGSTRTQWADALRAAGFPSRMNDSRRGALSSLVGLYELLLEAVQVRSARHEPQQVVVVAHLIGEFLPLLACEAMLGHAGDPGRMRALVGERWGTDDPSCSHSPVQRSTARRSVRVSRDDDVAFATYLERFHSRLGHTLAVCVMNDDTVEPGTRVEVGDGCREPCSWVLAAPEEKRLDLDARVRLALLYDGSPLVALRHHAPVGHFFAVPSMREIDRAWDQTWRKLTAQWPDGANPLAGAHRGGEGALPGLELLVSAVAGRTVAAGSALADIADELAATIG